jgi:hypothetical protein
VRALTVDSTLDADINDLISRKQDSLISWWGEYHSVWSTCSFVASRTYVVRLNSQLVLTCWLRILSILALDP